MCSSYSIATIIKIIKLRGTLQVLEGFCPILLRARSCFYHVNRSRVIVFSGDTNRLKHPKEFRFVVVFTRFYIAEYGTVITAQQRRVKREACPVAKRVVKLERDRAGVTAANITYRSIELDWGKSKASQRRSRVRN